MGPKTFLTCFVWVGFTGKKDKAAPKNYAGCKRPKTLKENTSILVHACFSP